MDSIATASDLDLSELSTFLKTQVAPHVLDWDQRDYFPMEAVRGLHKVGIFAASLPTTVGGRSHRMIDTRIWTMRPIFCTC